MAVPAQLPCMTCTHGAVCCSWGASVELGEAFQIAAAHGAATLEVTGDPADPIRTRVVNGRCVFQARETGLCTIHAAAYYPAVCRGFPWSDGLGGHYTGDLSICPEITGGVDETR